LVDLKSIYIEPAARTPLVDFNNLSGELIISGKSIPENASKVYEKLLNWVTEYSNNPRPLTNLRLNLEYFNTASSLWLAKIVKTLTSINNIEFTLIVHLYFPIEDFDDMEGEDLEEALSPFINMIGIPTINLGIKIYGTDENDKVIKESMVLI
jgi:hypothetical protein